MAPRLHRAWMAVVAALPLALGCADPEPPAVAGAPRVTRLPEPDDAIDARLMVALGQARNLHRQARLLLADASVGEAIAAVRRILALEFPPGAPEGEDVRLDAHALLAKLLVLRGDLDGAGAALDAGLALATRDSFFLGNLHTVRGEVLEARAAAQDALGTDAGRDAARALRRDAIAAYERSNELMERLQRRLVEDLRDAEPLEAP
jgi:hypothetical protein